MKPVYVRLKAAVPGGVFLENACAEDGAGSNIALYPLCLLVTVDISLTV